MGGLSLYGQKLFGDQIIAAGRFMSLHVADPTDAGSTVNEVPLIGTNYARFDIFGLMSPIDIATGASTLIGIVNIGPAAIDWGLLTYVGFWENLVAGNMVYSGQLSNAQDTPQGKQFQLLPGQFQVRIL